MGIVAFGLTCRGRKSLHVRLIGRAFAVNIYSTPGHISMTFGLAAVIRRLDVNIALARF